MQLCCRPKYWIVSKFRPGLLMIVIGTNDIDALNVTINDLANTLVRFAILCMNDCAVCKVILCPVLPRGPGRFQAQSVCFKDNRVALNEALAELCTSDSHVSMLTHQRFSNLAECLCNGVNLSDRADIPYCLHKLKFLNCYH